MISVIICSRMADISQELKDNIAATIGCEYELCVIDNSHNDYNIFSAYNEGVRRAKGDILCFMHEDVVFHSEKWGDTLNNHFRQFPRAGAVGVLGGHYLPKRPCYWNEPCKESANYIQGGMNNGQYQSHRVQHQQYRSGRTFVAALDGVFMAIPKQLFSSGLVRWDNQTFSGFHFYDADVCMQIHKADYEVELIWDILLEHRNKSVFDSAFISARKMWFEKWKDYLPVIKGIEMTKDDMDACERIMDATDESHAYYLVMHSKAYRLGKFILHPTWTNMKNLFSRAR